MSLGLQKGALLSGMLLLAACGGGGGDDDVPSDGVDNTPPPVGTTPDPIEPEDARVVRMTLDGAFIPLGGVGVLSVEPTFAESRVAAGERVVIVVKLPAGLRYQEESSSIQTESGTRGVSAFASPCEDGSSLITYDLGKAELDNAQDPDGLDDADARLIIGIEGVNNTASAAIQAAAADNSLAASCGANFDSESDVAVAVQ